MTVTVPLLDLKAQYATIRDEIEPVVRRVIESQWFILGPEVEGLEKEIAAYCGTAHAVGCASGSDAILLALMALGVGPGDEVICPSYSFFATAGSIHRLGARLVFADVDPATYLMDPDSTRAAAKRCRRLRAIMPVHLFGRCADMDAFLAIGAELGVPIVEDAAQAIGAQDATGARAGSRGVIGCFSFFPSKNLGAFGDGGMCTTNDARLADLLSIQRQHGSRPKYHHHVFGVNSRLDALHAAVLRVKLRHLDRWTAGRQANAAWYDRAFGAAGAATTATPLEGGGFPLRTPAQVAGPRERHIYNQYVIAVPAEMRDALRAELTAKGIGTEVYYPVPIHLQRCFSQLGGRPGDLPHTEAAADRTIALPIYAELTAEQKEHVVRTVVAFAGAHAAMAMR
jgi:dTDP-4-amino-4,6-dideoxygalactose transaminase